MAIKREKSQIKGAPPWLTTMGDMNNLLLCFFITMMGEDVLPIKNEDFSMILSGFKGSISFLQGGSTFTRGKLAEMGHNMMKLPSERSRMAFGRPAKALLEAFKPEIETKKIRLREDERGLVITLSSDIYFEPGSASINAAGRAILAKMTPILDKVPNFIRIEGHTDSSPTTKDAKKAGFETNWELSSARSVNILRYFSEDENIEPKKLSAAAYNQYRPIDDNNTPEGRGLNRRVDIVILRDRILEEGKDTRIKRPLPDEEWR